MTGDWDKLRRFRQEGDEEAFADLVREYINLVWTTAFRITGDADLAGDVAQTVFADFARKADRLPDTTILAGWLHRAASFAARRAVRDEIRRRSRERQAMELELAHEPASDELDPVLPFLDEAIAALRPNDRDAVLLRFFGKKSLAEIGAVFGVSEDAAQKRIGPQDGPLRWTWQDLTKTDHPSSSEEELIGRQLSISAQDFDFVPSAQPLTLEGPSTVIVQETKPRALPDGRYARWYGFTDGRVEEVVTTDPAAR